MAKASKTGGTPGAASGAEERGSQSEGGAESSRIAGLSYEHALAELESLIQRVEDGSLSLEAGIQSHRRAVLLLKHCESILNAAQTQIEEISARDLPAASGEPE